MFEYKNKKYENGFFITEERYPQNVDNWTLLKIQSKVTEFNKSVTDNDITFHSGYFGDYANVKYLNGDHVCINPVLNKHDDNSLTEVSLKDVKAKINLIKNEGFIDIIDEFRVVCQNADRLLVISITDERFRFYQSKFPIDILKYTDTFIDGNKVILRPLKNILNGVIMSDLFDIETSKEPINIDAAITFPPVSLYHSAELSAEISDYLTDCSISRLNDELEEHITALQDEWNEC